MIASNAAELVFLASLNKDQNPRSLYLYPVTYTIGARKGRDQSARRDHYLAAAKCFRVLSYFA